MGRYPGTYPCKVGVRIGEMAAIDQDALRFCFEAMIQETDLASLELAIEVCPRRHRCQVCTEEFVVQRLQFRCPKCAEPRETTCISGDELELAYLEVEEYGPSTVGAKRYSVRTTASRPSCASGFKSTAFFCLNFISSPGAGKTSLLERTLEPAADRARGRVDGRHPDGKRCQAAGAFHFPVKQITTGGTCHLDARMIERRWRIGRSKTSILLLIENVGNLVCPSSYDLGEAAKVVVLSVTEGEDKPLKYPSIFFKSDLMVLNKIDLLPYVPFDIEAAAENARKVHPEWRL